MFRQVAGWLVEAITAEALITLISPATAIAAVILFAVVAYGDKREISKTLQKLRLTKKSATYIAGVLLCLAGGMDVWRYWTTTSEPSTVQASTTTISRSNKAQPDIPPKPETLTSAPSMLSSTTPSTTEEPVALMRPLGTQASSSDPSKNKPTGDVPAVVRNTLLLPLPVSDTKYLIEVEIQSSGEIRDIGFTTMIKSASDENGKAVADIENGMTIFIRRIIPSEPQTISVPTPFSPETGKIEKASVTLLIEFTVPLSGRWRIAQDFDFVNDGYARLRWEHGARSERRVTRRGRI